VKTSGFCQVLHSRDEFSASLKELLIIIFFTVAIMYIFLQLLYYLFFYRCAIYNLCSLLCVIIYSYGRLLGIHLRISLSEVPNILHRMYVK